MLGSQDPHLRLWRVYLKKRAKLVHKSECNHAHETSNQKKIINCLHAACFSPVKSTWITAINNGNFTSWPGLTEHVVEKHLSKSTSRIKRHANQQRMNARSTKINEEEECNNEAETALDNGVKTHCVYAATNDTGQIYTDQTGRFPVVSRNGKIYIIVLYEYDGNVMMSEPIKNITAAELLRAFQVIEQKINARGLKQRLVRLDNEAVQLLKNYLYEQDMSFQMLPPYSHRQHAA
jgi:hypothetical protein